MSITIRKLNESQDKAVEMPRNGLVLDAVMDALRYPTNGVPLNEHLIQWGSDDDYFVAMSERRELAMLDVDFHRQAPPARARLVALMQAIEPAPALWWVSKNGGLHLFYTASGDPNELGADELASFEGWKSPERVLELVRLGVAMRPGVEREHVTAVRERLPAPDRVLEFELEPIPISSSDIRARLRAGHSVRYLLPEAVREAVLRSGVYGPRPAR